MKPDKDWTEAMRHALRSAETPPPAGGWERLRDAMDGRAVRRMAMRRIWLRYGAAAAVVLLALSGGELLWRGYDGPQLSESSAPLVASAVTAAGGETASDEASLSGFEPFAEAPGGLRSGAGGERAVAQPVPAVRSSVQGDRSGRSSSGEGVAAQPKATAGEATSEQAAERQPDVPRSAADDTAANAQGHVQGHATGGAGSRSDRALTAAAAGRADRRSDAGLRSRSRSGGVALALFGGSGASGATQSGRVSGLPMVDAFMASNGNGMVMLARSGYSDASFRHHLPLSFGLSVGKEFRHGLWLESGLCYTLLRSEVRMRSASEQSRQELHFIGIPLRANWRFLERGAFSLYAGAGGMVERCVSAKMGSHAVDEPGVQWSLLAAAGAQYRLGGMAALYFEPEASYYLNDTKLRTSRTDTPLTLSLRLGVRLMF